MRRTRYDCLVMRYSNMLMAMPTIAMVVGVSALMIAAISFGCEERDPRALTDSPSASPEAESPWRVDDVNGERSVRRSIERAEMHEQLAAAIEQARETADKARRQWRETPESQQHRWAVKWAARIADDADAVEHVWVRPLHWSPFRIEGILLNEPDRPLAASGTSPSRGEIVSFPVEELSDWVRWHADKPNDRRDGGFTIAVLERTGG